MGPRGGEGSQGSADPVCAVLPGIGCADVRAGLMTPPPTTKRKGAGNCLDHRPPISLCRPKAGETIAGPPTCTSGVRSRPSRPKCAEPHYKWEIRLFSRTCVNANAYTHMRTLTRRHMQTEHTHLYPFCPLPPRFAHGHFAESAAQDAVPQFTWHDPSAIISSESYVQKNRARTGMASRS